MTPAHSDLTQHSSLLITHHCACAVEFPSQMLHMHTCTHAHRRTFGPHTHLRAKTCSRVLRFSQPLSLDHQHQIPSQAGAHARDQIQGAGPKICGRLDLPLTGIVTRFFMLSLISVFSFAGPSPMHTLETPTKDLNGAPPTMHMTPERTEDQGLVAQNHCV